MMKPNRMNYACRVAFVLIGATAAACSSGPNGAPSPEVVIETGYMLCYMSAQECSGGSGCQQSNGNWICAPSMPECSEWGCACLEGEICKENTCASQPDGGLMCEELLATTPDLPDTDGAKGDGNTLNAGDSIAPSGDTDDVSTWPPLPPSDGNEHPEDVPDAQVEDIASSEDIEAPETDAEDSIDDAEKSDAGDENDTRDDVFLRDDVTNTEEDDSGDTEPGPEEPEAEQCVASGGCPEQQCEAAACLPTGECAPIAGPPSPLTASTGALCALSGEPGEERACDIRAFAGDTPAIGAVQFTLRYDPETVLFSGFWAQHTVGGEKIWVKVPPASLKPNDHSVAVRERQEEGIVAVVILSSSKPTSAVSPDGGLMVQGRWTLKSGLAEPSSTVVSLLDLAAVDTDFAPRCLDVVSASDGAILQLSTDPACAPALLCHECGQSSPDSASLLPAHSGDLNNDGILNVQDVNCAVTAALHRAAGDAPPACLGLPTSHADLDCDGRFTVRDSLRTALLVLHKLTGDPSLKSLLQKEDSNDNKVHNCCEPTP